MQGALGFGLLPIGMDASDVGLSLVGRVARVGASRWFAGCWSSSREQDVRVDDGRSRWPLFWPIRHLNMAAGPGSRKHATGLPPLVDWFGLSRIPSIHEPGASVKIAHPTRVVELPGSLF